MLNSYIQEGEVEGLRQLDGTVTLSRGSGGGVRRKLVLHSKVCFDFG